MDRITKGFIVSKFLASCDINKGSAIFSFLTEETENQCTLFNLPKIIESGISIINNKVKGQGKKSIFYVRFHKDKQNILKLFNDLNNFIKSKDGIIINDNKIDASLAVISSAYLDTFIKPIQFFLPQSSACSGKWKFWDNIDYLSYKQKMHDKEFNFKLRETIQSHKIWNLKFDIKTFPLIIQKRLKKENLLDKKLNPEALIKAMIIRLGEMGRPFISYEIIDFSIREFFTYAGAKKYIRVDREIAFLRNFEAELAKILMHVLEDR